MKEVGLPSFATRRHCKTLGIIKDDSGVSVFTCKNEDDITTVFSAAFAAIS